MRKQLKQPRLEGSRFWKKRGTVEKQNDILQPLFPQVHLLILGQKAENPDSPSAEEPWELLEEVKSKTQGVKIPVQEESRRTGPNKRLAFRWRHLPNSAVAQRGLQNKTKKSGVEFSTISLFSGDKDYSIEDTRRRDPCEFTKLSVGSPGCLATC